MGNVVGGTVSGVRMRPYVPGSVCYDNFSSRLGVDERNLRRPPPSRDESRGRRSSRPKVRWERDRERGPPATSGRRARGGEHGEEPETKGEESPGPQNLEFLPLTLSFAHCRNRGRLT